MKSNIFLRVIILLCLLPSFVCAATDIAPQEAKAWVQNQGNALLDAFGEPDLNRKYASLDKMLAESIDLNYVAKFVMGKYWRQMTSAQQEEYLPLFQRYAMSIYKGFPLSFDVSRINFEVDRIRQENNGVSVKTKIRLSESNPQQNALNEVVVEFKLHRNDGKIQIIDLKLGESSLILSYRSRFYDMIARNDDDVEWFMEDLRDITDAAERTNRQKLEDAE